MLLALLLAATPATSNAIIWKGSNDPAAARELFDAWPKDEAIWSRRVKLAEGYPRLVKSDDVPGLKPGFHVVLLGICNAEQVRPRTRTLKDLYPMTYWRPLTAAQPDACPEVYCTDTDDMAAVPGGTFLEGADSHSRELGAFEVDRREVSRGAYAACVALKACSPLGDGEADQPALGTYKQAWEYCGFQGKRLVSTDEWEKAGRGTDGRRYPWGARVPDCSLGQGPECGGLTRVGAFPAWTSPDGLLDLFGNAPEWVNGPLVMKDGVKHFPTRGEAASSKDFALWLSGTAPLDAQRGFRCARACVWKPGSAVSKLPAPVDVALPTEPAHQAVSDPKVREALERWRAQRTKELGEGGSVEWRGQTTADWQSASNYIRERVGGTCLEGPIRFDGKHPGGQAEVVRSARSNGPIACCSEKCGPRSPEETVLRFMEALRSNDSARVDAFIPQGGVRYEYQYNDDKPVRKRFKRGDLTDFGRLEFDDSLYDISCKPADASGVAECRTESSTVMVKRLKTDTVITEVSQYVSEGC